MANPTPKPERDAALIAEVAKGRTYLDVAKEFGISKQRVLQILVRNGTWRRKYFPWTESEFEAIERLWPRASWEEILAALPNRKKFAICVRAAQLGIRRLVPRLIPYVYTPERVAQIRQLRGEGKGWAEIALALGLDRHCLTANVTRIAPELRTRLRGSNKTPQEHAEIIAAQGTQEAIARRYGITQWRVSELKRKARQQSG